MRCVDYTREEIGAILKQQRLGTEMTQRKVAERLGRRQQIVGHWETGYAQPDLNTFFQLCTLYRTDIGTVFGCGEHPDLAFTREECDLVSAYRMSTADERELIDVILKKYKDGTALSLLNTLYTTPVSRWLPDKDHNG